MNKVMLIAALIATSCLSDTIPMAPLPYVDSRLSAANRRIEEIEDAIQSGILTNEYKSVSGTNDAVRLSYPASGTYDGAFMIRVAGTPDKKTYSNSKLGISYHVVDADYVYAKTNEFDDIDIVYEYEVDSEIIVETNRLWDVEVKSEPIWGQPYMSTVIGTNFIDGMQFVVTNTYEVPAQIERFVDTYITNGFTDVVSTYTNEFFVSYPVTNRTSFTSIYATTTRYEKVWIDGATRLNQSSIYNTSHLVDGSGFGATVVNFPCSDETKESTYAR